jgi:hypothetical protein
MKNRSLLSPWKIRKVIFLAQTMPPWTTACQTLQHATDMKLIAGICNLPDYCAATASTMA